MTGATRSIVIASPEGVRALADVSLAELAAHHAQAIGLVVNRADTHSAREIRTALTEAQPDLPVWTIPEEPFLTAPTVGQLLEAVDGTLVLGDPELLGREALDLSLIHI